MSTPIVIDLEVTTPAAVALEVATPEVDVTPDSDGAHVVVVAVPGPPGPQGEGGGVEYIHTQASPSSSWTVPHGLGKQIVTATVYSLDLATQYDGVFVEYVDDNTSRLWMSPPLAGRARII